MGGTISTSDDEALLCNIRQDLRRAEARSLPQSPVHTPAETTPAAGARISSTNPLPPNLPPRLGAANMSVMERTPAVNITNSCTIFSARDYRLLCYSRAATSNQWWELWDSNTQRHYYFNTFTKETVWHRPDDQTCDIIPLAKIQTGNKDLSCKHRHTGNSSEKKGSQKVSLSSQGSAARLTNSSHDSPQGWKCSKHIRTGEHRHNVVSHESGGGTGGERLKVRRSSHDGAAARQQSHCCNHKVSSSHHNCKTRSRPGVSQRHHVSKGLPGGGGPCFGCSMEKGNGTCCNETASKKTPNAGDATPMTHRRHHHHHHHRCYKHKRYHHSSSQTQTGTSDKIGVMDSSDAPSSRRSSANLSTRSIVGSNMSCAVSLTPASVISSGNQQCRHGTGAGISGNIETNGESVEADDPFQVRACGHGMALQRQTSAGFEKLIFNRRFSDIHAEHSTQDLTRAPTNSGAVDNSKFKVQHLDIGGSQDSVHNVPHGFSNYAVHSTPSPGDAAADSLLIPRKEQHSPSPPPSSSGYEVPFASGVGQCGKLRRTSDSLQDSPQRGIGGAKDLSSKYVQDVSSSNSSHSAYSSPKRDLGQRAVTEVSKVTRRAVLNREFSEGIECIDRRKSGHEYKRDSQIESCIVKLNPPPKGNSSCYSELIKFDVSARKTTAEELNLHVSSLGDQRPTIPLRNCKSHHDLIGKESEAGYGIASYENVLDTLRTAAEEVLYENTGRNFAQGCSCNKYELNPLNPFLHHCCDRNSPNGDESTDSSLSSKRNLSRNSKIEALHVDTTESGTSSTHENGQTYETLSNYTSSAIQSREIGAGNSGLPRLIPLKGYDDGLQRSPSDCLLRKASKSCVELDVDLSDDNGIYDRVASDEELDHVCQESDAFLSNDEFCDYPGGIYQNESRIRTASESGGMHPAPAILREKFTPPSSRDILAAVESKMGNLRVSCSPARPPKSSNLELIGVGCSSPGGGGFTAADHRSSIASHDSSGSNKLFNVSASKEQISTMTTDSSDQYRTGDSSLFSLPNMSHICTQEESINRLYEDVQGGIGIGISTTATSHVLDSVDMPIYDQPCCDSDTNEQDRLQILDQSIDGSADGACPELGLSNSFLSNYPDLCNQSVVTSAEAKSPFSRGVSASGDTLNLTRKSGLFKKKQTTSEVMKWTKDILREPLIVDKRLKKEAVECFKLIQIYMGDRKVSYNYRAMSEDDIQINCAFELAMKGYEIPPLRNELFLQVCKQSIDNSKQCSVKLGWELLAIFLTFFAPTDKVLQYIENFLTEYSKEDDDSCISSDNQTSTAAAVESQGSSLAAQESQSVELEEGAFPTALEKMCRIPARKYASHCWKQLNKIVSITEDCFPVKKPSIEDIVSARNGLHQLGAFGSGLTELMEDQKTSENELIRTLPVPWIMFALVRQIIIAKGQSCEGIMRVSGDADMMQKLRYEVNSYPANEPPLSDSFWAHYDVHVLAGLLKQWFRQLDEPVIPFSFYQQSIDAVACNDVKALLQLVDEIPEPNRTVLIYLIAFLQQIVSQSDLNKMTSRNISLVVAPNCLWSQTRDPQLMLQNSQFESSVIQVLIENLNTACANDTFLCFASIILK